MKNGQKIFFGFAALSLASGCTLIPAEAYKDRHPENLLTASTQSVDIDLRSGNSATQIANWINKEEPTSAILSCTNQQSCTRAKEVLNQFGVPFEERAGNGDTVTLVYDTIVARDCDNRYITNHINPYNLHHPTFGCSIAVNTVQMVGDKRQFTDPMLLGPYDGQKATQNYDDYLSRADRTNTTGSESSSNAGALNSSEIQN